jgi:hypothetical protein
MTEARGADGRLLNVRGAAGVQRSPQLRVIVSCKGASKPFVLFANNSDR